MKFEFISVEYVFVCFFLRENVLLKLFSMEHSKSKAKIQEMTSQQARHQPKLQFFELKRQMLKIQEKGIENVSLAQTRTYENLGNKTISTNVKWHIMASKRLENSLLSFAAKMKLHPVIHLIAFLNCRSGMQLKKIISIFHHFLIYVRSLKDKSFLSPKQNLKIFLLLFLDPNPVVFTKNVARVTIYSIQIMRKIHFAHS